MTFSIVEDYLLSLIKLYSLAVNISNLPLQYMLNSNAWATWKNNRFLVFHDGKPGLEAREGNIKIEGALLRSDGQLGI